MGSIAVNAMELVFMVLIIAVVVIGTIATLYQNQNIISTQFWDLAGLGVIMLFIATAFLFAYYKIRRN